KTPRRRRGASSAASLIWSTTSWSLTVTGTINTPFEVSIKHLEVIMSTTGVPSATKAPQVRLSRVTDSYFRVVLDNPPLNLMGPEFVWQIREIVTTLENDDLVKVVVF